MTRYFLIVFLLVLNSCSSVDKQRKTLMKYRWKDSSEEFLGYDILVFDTVQSSDTGYFVVSRDMVLTKNNRLIGEVTSVSNREVVIQKTDNKMVT